MTTVAQVNEWLAGLEVDDEDGPLFYLDEDGVCGIINEEGVPHYIELSEDHQIMICHTTVAQTDLHGDLLSLFTRALHLNLFGLETQGGHLGLDIDTSALVFSQQWPITALDKGLFKEALEAFMNLASNFRATLQPLEQMTTSTIEKVFKKQL